MVLALREGPKISEDKILTEKVRILMFRRVTIRGHNPPQGSPRKFSAGVSPRVLQGLCGVLLGSAGFAEVFGGSDPMLVTLENCWRGKGLQGFLAFRH